MRTERGSAEVADSDLKKVQEFLDLVEEYELPTPHPLISQDLYDSLRSLTTRLSELQRENERLVKAVSPAGTFDAFMEVSDRLSRLEEALGGLVNKFARFYLLAEEGDLATLKQEMDRAGRTALDSETKERCPTCGSDFHPHREIIETGITVSGGRQCTNPWHTDSETKTG